MNDKQPINNLQEHLNRLQSATLEELMYPCRYSTFPHNLPSMYQPPDTPEEPLHWPTINPEDVHPVSYYLEGHAPLDDRLPTQGGDNIVESSSTGNVVPPAVVTSVNMPLVTSGTTNMQPNFKIELQTTSRHLVQLIDEQNKILIEQENDEENPRYAELEQEIAAARKKVEDLQQAIKNTRNVAPKTPEPNAVKSAVVPATGQSPIVTPIQKSNTVSFNTMNIPTPSTTQQNTSGIPTRTTLSASFTNTTPLQTRQSPPSVISPITTTTATTPIVSRMQATPISRVALTATPSSVSPFQQMETSVSTTSNSPLSPPYQHHAGSSGFATPFFNSTPPTTSNQTSTGTSTNFPRSGFTWETAAVPNPVHESQLSTTTNPTDAKAKKYPWSHEVQCLLRDVFGLRSFRPLQLEAINTTLSGEDCFVVLPTGGGKSLCYQLPALVGSSQAVTIVISPLISLIQDQVDGLRSINVKAMELTGDTKECDKAELYEDWKSPEGCKYLLVYFTPERFGKSDALINKLKDLYKAGRLNRIVIDEAHCISSWGHDFRPDYKKLSVLKTLFPTTPIMALTATATEFVTQDVLTTLHMPKAKIFRGSFNRTNLCYRIDKSGKMEVANLIRSEFSGQCGIVYCLSQKDTEDMAKTLSKAGIRAAFYHASASKKGESQAEWTSGRIAVMCATIAFGMGINKPDVRFVIHEAMPKSLEGYYQESGRAGRDLQRSVCVMLYSSKDKQRFQRMMLHSPQSIEQNNQHLYRVMQFCTDEVTCRRKYQLQYFGEMCPDFLCLTDKSNELCDVCASKERENWTVESVDVIEHVVAILTILSELGSCRVTLKQLISIYRGTVSGIGKVAEAKHNRNPLPKFGEGKAVKQEAIEAVGLLMLTNGLIREHLEAMAASREYQNVVAYLQLTDEGMKKLQEIKSGRVKSEFLAQFTIKQRKAAERNLPAPPQLNLVTTNPAKPDGNETEKKRTRTLSTNTRKIVKIGQFEGSPVREPDEVDMVEALPLVKQPSNQSPTPSVPVMPAPSRQALTVAPPAIPQKISEEALKLRQLLRAQLVDVRADIARTEGIREYTLLNNTTLDELADLILKPYPPSVAEIRDVQGFGKVKLRKYGRTILEHLRGFRAKYFKDCEPEITEEEAKEMDDSTSDAPQRPYPKGQVISTSDEESATPPLPRSTPLPTPPPANQTQFVNNGTVGGYNNISNSAPPQQQQLLHVSRPLPPAPPTPKRTTLFSFAGTSANAVTPAPPTPNSGKNTVVNLNTPSVASITPPPWAGDSSPSPELDAHMNRNMDGDVIVLDSPSPKKVKLTP